MKTDRKESSEGGSLSSHDIELINKMITAVKRRDVNELQEVFKRVPPERLPILINLSIEAERGDSLLHLAVRNVNPEIVPVLVSNGASLFNVNAMGDTPLHTAVKLSKSFRTDVLSIILEKIENDSSLKKLLFIMNRDNEFPINIALKQPDNEEVFAMLMPFYKDFRDSDGNTPFHYAAMSCRPELMGYFANEEKIHFVKNKLGQTALDIAATKANSEELLVPIFAALIRKQDVLSFSSFIQQHIRSKPNYETFETYELFIKLAVIWKRDDIVKFILNKMGFPAQQRSALCCSALTDAIENQNMDLTKYLFGIKASIDEAGLLYEKYRPRDEAWLLPRLKQNEEEIRNALKTIYMQILVPFVENQLRREYRTEADEKKSLFFEITPDQDPTMPLASPGPALPANEMHQEKILKLKEDIKELLLIEVNKLIDKILSFPPDKDFDDLQKAINQPFIKIVKDKLYPDSPKALEEEFNYLYREGQLRILVQGLIEYNRNKMRTSIASTLDSTAAPPSAATTTDSPAMSVVSSPDSSASIPDSAAMERDSAAPATHPIKSSENLSAATAHDSFYSPKTTKAKQVEKKRPPASRVVKRNMSR